MPLLTEAEMKKIVGVSQFDSLFGTGESQADFEKSELAASDAVVQITGITIPADASEAPDWCKEPTAHIIVYANIGRTSKDEKVVKWAEGLRTIAIENLQRHRIATPTGRVAPERGTIEGSATW